MNPDPEGLPLDALPGDRARGDALVGPHAEALDRWLRGLGPLPPLDAAPLAHTGAAPAVAPRELPDEELADLAEDWIPEIGLLGERITGDPWAPVSVAVAAALAFVPELARGRRVIDHLKRDALDAPSKRTVAIIAQSPPLIFGDGRPLIRPGPLWDARPPSPHGVGRPYRVAGGWAWSGFVPLPRAPAAGPLRRRLRALALGRPFAPGLTVEELSRAAPDVVYRAAHEGAWRAGEQG